MDLLSWQNEKKIKIENNIMKKYKNRKWERNWEMWEYKRDFSFTHLCFIIEEWKSKEIENRVCINLLSYSIT